VKYVKCVSGSGSDKDGVSCGNELRVFGVVVIAYVIRRERKMMMSLGNWIWRL
jgi:hypothetical protein